MAKGLLGKFFHVCNHRESEANDRIKILEKHLEELEKLNEKERVRRETIRSKGNIIIGITSLVSGVIIAMSIFIQKEADITKPWLIVFASITFVLTVSILFVIFNVFKITHKDKVSLLGPSDLKSEDIKSYKSYIESLISENEKAFNANTKSINEKVDFMVKANIGVLVTSFIFVVYTLVLLIWVCIRPANDSVNSSKYIDIELNWNQTYIINSDSVPSDIKQTGM